MPKKLTNDEFTSRLHKKFPYIEPLEMYEGSLTPMRFRCNQCNNLFITNPNTVLSSDYGCPKCARKISGNKSANKTRKTQEEFERELKKANPQIIVIGTYRGGHYPVKCKCSICNSVWEPLAYNILQNKQRCPTCTRSNTSLIEQLIYWSLVTLLGKDNVINRDRKTIGKELDIYLPQYKVAIEFGAWHWHKDKIEQDREKFDLCLEKHINLYHLYEGCENLQNLKHLDEMLPNVVGFENAISNETQFITIRKWIKFFCSIYNIDASLIDTQWEQIIQKAVDNSRKKSESDFIKDLNQTNCSIEYVSGYINSQLPVLVRCKECDYEWETIPTSLLIKRTGCPNCKHCKKLTNEEFVEKLKLINPTIKPLEPYTNSNSRIKVLCSVCNSEFYSTPAQLLSVGKVSKGHTKGTGCRVCANRFNSKRLKKSVICIETSMKYDSVLDASNQLGINAKGIASVCRGERHTAGGYHWKYHDGDS